MHGQEPRKSKPESRSLYCASRRPTRKPLSLSSSKVLGLFDNILSQLNHKLAIGTFTFSKPEDSPHKNPALLLLLWRLSPHVIGQGQICFRSCERQRHSFLIWSGSPVASTGPWILSGFPRPGEPVLHCRARCGWESSAPDTCRTAWLCWSRCTLNSPSLVSVKRIRSVSCLPWDMRGFERQKSSLPEAAQHRSPFRPLRYVANKS